MANNNIITGKQYTVKSIPAANVARMLDYLPAVQDVRGSVWAKAVSENLAAAIRDGLYVPPVVLAGDADDAALTDGQQRSLAIAAAVEAGVLTGKESVLVAIDAGRTVEESFAALNLGVPVGASLVAAMDSGAAGHAVIDLASHPYFAAINWTAVQSRRTARADFAAAMIAVFAGWETPESSAKACNAWIAANADMCGADIVETCKDVLTDLQTACKPYEAAAAVKGKGGKDARRVLADLRKKNLFLTLCGAVAEGAAVSDVVKVYSRPDLLTDVQYPEKAKNGREVMRVAQWSVGAGSSGSYTEYKQRLIVMREALKHVDIPAPVGAEKKAAAELANVPGAELASALGV